MHKLVLNWGICITTRALSRLSYYSPGGVLCPNLEQLIWEFDWSHLPLFYTRLFFSPSLKHITLSTSFISPTLRPEVLGPLTEAVSCLPTSLEYLSLVCGLGGEPLRGAISSFVCRSGSSLRSFGSSEPLSEAAFNHLMQLPNLRSWAVYEPLRTLPPAPFPSLEELRLGPGGLPWLHLLAAHGDDQTRDGLAPPPAMLNTNVKATLKILNLPRNTPVDPMLLSLISSFRNLVTLCVENYYCNKEGSCVFRLTDDDVENLAVTLPSLVSLQLGRVCNSNACHTSLSSLLSVSIHCLGLELLEIHFTTQAIVDNIQRLLDEDPGRDKPRCKLRSLLVGYLPLQVCREDVGKVAIGLAYIFPCLKKISGVFSDSDEGRSWECVASELQG